MTATRPTPIASRIRPPLRLVVAATGPEDEPLWSDFLPDEWLPDEEETHPEPGDFWIADDDWDEAA